MLGDRTTLSSHKANFSRCYPEELEGVKGCKNNEDIVIPLLTTFAGPKITLVTGLIVFGLTFFLSTLILQLFLLTFALILSRRASPENNFL